AQGVEVHVAGTEIKLKPDEEPKKDDEPKPAAGATAQADTAPKTQQTNNPTTQLPKNPITIPAGSYIVRMDQPYSRMADMLLDKQFYSPSDPRPYDDTGWTLGALRNLKTIRVTDNSALGAPMKLLTGDAKVEGKVLSTASSVAYLINHTTENP